MSFNNVKAVYIVALYNHFLKLSTKIQIDIAVVEFLPVGITTI